MPEDNESRDFQRRLPAVERAVGEIRQDDIRVRVLGTVLDVQGNRVVVDDGTGKIDAVFDKAPGVEANQVVRVFGRVISLEDGFELQGEFAQKVEGLDTELRKKVLELEKKEKP